MNTTISFNATSTESTKTRRLARARGFRTTSDYLRYLLAQDDVDLISENELVARAADVDKLYKDGKLIRAKSLVDLIK
jgi:hypothetical protein